MFILKYFKRCEELPDPRGLLSSSISSAAIAAANSKVRKVTDGDGLESMENTMGYLLL